MPETVAPPGPTTPAVPTPERFLRIEIKNQELVSLEDLSRSLNALSEEYKDWVLGNKEQGDADEIALYVREIRSGSIIAEFVALAPNFLPYVANAVTVMDFGEWLQKGYNFLLNRGQSDPPPDRTLERLATIVEPTAKEGGSQTNISVVVNGDVHNHFTLNNTEANAAQNKARRMVKPPQEKVTGDHTEVVLALKQARYDPKSSSGDRGVIESIYSRPVRVIFAPKSLKANVVATEGNPFKGSFLVDVTVETVDGRPVVYKITAVHEALDGGEEDVA